jgi:PIN domain nuclease of toxin-antitoxin system
MPYLLDTHVAYWAFLAPELLSKRVRKILVEDPEPKFVSPVSAYELTFKAALGKLDRLPGAFNHLSKEAGFEDLPLTMPQAELAARLPFAVRDPWDRLLAAQAIISGCTLISRDADIPQLGVSTCW